MLEAVKPVLLEKVEIIWSQFTNSGIDRPFHCNVTVLVTRPVYPTTQLLTLHCLY